MLKAFVARNQNGAVSKGWILRGTDKPTSLFRRALDNARIEEVKIEEALRGAQASSRSASPSSRDAKTDAPTEAASGEPN